MNYNAHLCWNASVLVIIVTALIYRYLDSGLYSGNRASVICRIAGQTSVLFEIPLLYVYYMSHLIVESNNTRALVSVNLYHAYLHRHHAQYPNH